MFSQDECYPATNPFCEDIDIPLDGGVIILVATGAVYACRRIRQEKN